MHGGKNHEYTRFENKKAREKAGLMQADLASKIGVKSAGVISNWETDKSKPDADKIVALCEALDVSCSYLLDYYGATEVSSVEMQLLKEFRELNEEGQDALFKYLRYLISEGYIKSDSAFLVEKSS